MSVDLDKATEYDRKVFLVAYNASVVYKIRPDSKSGKKVNELIGYYKNYLETGDRRDLERVKSFFIPKKKSVLPKEKFLKKIQVGGSGTPEAKDLLSRNLDAGELSSLDKEQKREIVRLTKQQLDKKEQKEEVEIELKRKSEEQQKQITMLLESQALTQEMLGKIIETLNITQTQGKRLIEMEKKTFVEILKSNPRNLSWKDTIVGYMTTSFKKLLLAWPVATYEVAKFCAYNTFVYPVKYTLKKARNAYSTIVGVLGLIFIGGIVYYTYSNVSENEFMNEICKERQMILCSNWEREIVLNAYRAVVEPLEIGVSYAKAPYEYTVEIAVIGWKIFWSDIYKYFTGLFKVFLKDSGVPSFLLS